MPPVYRIVTRIQDQDDFSGSLTNGYYLKYDSGSGTFILDVLSGSSTNVLVNGGTVGTSGVGVVAVALGTVPTSAPADEVQLYAADYTAGDCRVQVLTESGAALWLGNGKLEAKAPASGAGNSLTLAGSAAVSGNTNGGDVTLTPGAKSGSGADGNVRTTVGRFVPNPSANSGVPAISNSAGTAGLWFSVDNRLGLISNNLLWCSLVSETIGLRSASSLSWSYISDPNAAKDTGLARSSAAVVRVTNGSTGTGSLICGTTDSGTTTVTNGLTIGHQSTGTPAAGLGSATLYRINSSTTADQDAGRVTAYWTDATHATRTAAVGIEVVSNAGALAEVLRVTGSGTIATGLSVTGNAAGSGVTLTVLSSGTNESLVLQPKGTGTVTVGNSSTPVTGIRILGSGGIDSTISVTSGQKITVAGLEAVGPVVWASGFASLGGSSGNVTVVTVSNTHVSVTPNGTGRTRLTKSTSATSTVEVLAQLMHNSSGTPAAGFGGSHLFSLDSSTTDDQDAVQVAALWTVATHASRTSEYSVRTVTNAGALAEVARFDGGGGATPSAGNTGLMLWDVDNGTLERVTVGAADSGGLGFKCLRIPN